MTAPDSGEDFVKQLPTEGLVNAKCYAVIDLGSQETEWKGNKKMQRKIQVSFETDQMGTFWDKWELPLCLWNSYSFFITDNSNLYKDLASWLGWTQPNKTFNVFDLVGMTAELMVSHETTKKWKPFAKIVKIKPGKKDWELINKPIMFSLEQFNEDEFFKLPEFLQKQIQATPEYDSILKAMDDTTPAQSKVDELKAKAKAKDEDELPF